MITTLLSLVLLTSQVPDNLGGFVGVLNYDKSVAQFEVDFDPKNPRTWINYSSYENSGVIPMQNLQIKGNLISFDISTAQGELKGKTSFAGKLTVKGLDGTYTSGGKSGSFALVREVVVPGAKMRPLYGLYKTPDGRHLGIVSGYGLGLVEYGSGMLRNLRPTSERTYEAGPTFMTTVPVQADISFDASSPAESFTLNELGKRSVVAKRMHFKEEKVTFSNGDTTFAGTLITPDKPGRHPVVVAVPGDYGTVRDHMRIFGHNFLVAGVGLLLYDGRGGGESAGTAQSSTFDLLADDTLAAVQMLKGKPQVDSSRIGLFGYSNSAWTTALAAARSRDVAFVVNHSMSGVPPWQQETARVELTARGEGLPVTEVQQAVAFMRKKFEVARTGEGWEALEAQMNAAGGSRWLPMTNPPVSRERLIASWTRMVYDPLPALKGLSCPVLLVWGANDVFVPPHESMRVVQQTFSPAQLARTKLVMLKNSSHSMMDVRTNSIRETMSVTRFRPDYFKLVRDWVREVVK